MPINIKHFLSYNKTYSHKNYIHLHTHTKSYIIHANHFESSFIKNMQIIHTIPTCDKIYYFLKFFNTKDLYRNRINFNWFDDYCLLTEIFCKKFLMDFQFFLVLVKGFMVYIENL